MLELKAPRTDLRSMFVPVIFANGVDDDLPGIAAACKDEPVQYEDVVYKPGEAITLYGVTLRIFASGVKFVGDGEPLELRPSPCDESGVAVVHVRETGRAVSFDHCNFLFGAK